MENKFIINVARFTQQFTDYGVVPSASGEYVRFYDYENLCSKLEQAYGEISKLDAIVRDLKQELATALASSQAAKTTPETEKFEAIPDYADVISVEEFGELEDSGCIMVGEDGTAYWCNPELNRMCRNFRAIKPEWATHVAWFNK